MTRDSDLVLVSRSGKMETLCFLSKEPDRLHPRENVSCDVCSDRCFFTSSLMGLQEEERLIFPLTPQITRQKRGQEEMIFG